MQTTDFATMKATDLRELVKNTPGALDALTEPVSRANRDALVAALEAVAEPARGPWTVLDASGIDQSHHATKREAVAAALALAEHVSGTGGVGAAVERVRDQAIVWSSVREQADDEPKPRSVGNRSFTDEQAAETVRLRHEDLMSWRQIAAAQGYGTPGVARRAYRHATGCEGVLPRIAGKSGRPTAGMVAGTEQPQVFGAAPTDEPA